MKINDKKLESIIELYLGEVRKSLDKLNKSDLINALKILVDAFNHGKTVFILGNGGSASTSSHMAADLSKGTLSRVYDKKEKRLRAISLIDNTALLSAYGNDLSFDEIFIQQLNNLVKKDDVVIALSGSGTSKNIVKAVEYAKQCGAKTIGLLGFKKGGKLSEIVDCSIVVQSNHYGPIEDVHLICNHLLTTLFAKLKNESGKFGKNDNLSMPFRKV